VAESGRDICIIGSGAAGGIAAYTLARLGASVTVLEAGDWIRPSEFRSWKWPYEFPARGLHREYTSHIFSPEPYETRGEPRFRFGVVRAVGGKSLMWSAHAFRFSAPDFLSARTMGSDIDWPIRYEDVKPYYEKVEALIGMAGSHDHPNVPGGRYMKDIGLRCCDGELKKGLDRRKLGEVLFPIPKAITTEKGRERAPCVWCGGCNYGCAVEAKYTSANTPIPKALATGNCELITNAHAVGFRMSAGKPEAVRYIDTEKNEEREVAARAFVVACGPVETPRLLLASGLANSSGQVGRNLMSHINGMVSGYLPALEDSPVINDDGTDNFHGMIPDIYWNNPSPDFRGGYQIQTTGGATNGLHFGRPVSFASAIEGYGASFKRQVRERFPSLVALAPQGTMLPSPRNFVELDPNHKNEAGLPVPIIHMNYGENEKAMARDMFERCGEIIEAAGGKVTRSPERNGHDPFHYVGTCRMGDDPKRSVTNSYGQSHDLPNVFVADGSVFTAYPEKNPTLTVMSLAMRSSEYLAEQLEKGQI
jgi:choline dehydrogenase-like flavoprotein